LAEYGFGQPACAFYPPLSWMLGAALVSVLPLNAAPAIFVLIVLLIAGLCMFALALRILPARAAMTAAVWYAVNPFHLLTAYQLGAFAELFASALFPLVVLGVLRLEHHWRTGVTLALGIAAIWLTNFPAAVIASYAAALMILVAALRLRSGRIFVNGAIALGLGLALAAFIVLPAAYERRWVNIYEALIPDLSPESNFLFGWDYDPDAGWFPVVLSTVALCEIGLIAIAAVLSRKWSRRNPPWWPIVVIAAAGAVFLMFPITGPLWRHLPELPYVQFPWRALFIVNCSLAVLIAAMFAGSSVHASRLVLPVLLVAGGVGAGWTAKWAHGAVTQIAQSVSAEGYGGRPEYMPQGSHYQLIWQWVFKMPKVAEANSAGQPLNDQESQLRVSVQEWGPEQKAIDISSPHRTRIMLRLLNYPIWKVMLNGAQISPLTQPETGQIIVPVPQGHSKVEVRYRRTWDRTAGSIISLAACLLLMEMACNSAQSKTLRGRSGA